MFDETYCKAGEMDKECFSERLSFRQTEIMRKIKDDLLDGSKAAQNTTYVLDKLNVYGMNLILIHQSPPFDAVLLLRQRFVLQTSCRYSTQQYDVWHARDRISNSP